VHPLDRWLGPALGRFFLVSCALTIPTMVCLARVDAALRGPNAPLGIVSFEFAGRGAAAVLSGWTEAQRRDALFVQGLDYLFLVLYSTTLACAALLVGRRCAGRLRAASGPAAWAFLLAAVADAVENAPMVAMLRAGVADPRGALVSLACASAKFALLVLGGVYLLAAGGAVAVGRLRRAG
jgi:hypothetical protein